MERLTSGFGDLVDGVAGFHRVRACTRHSDDVAPSRLLLAIRGALHSDFELKYLSRLQVSDVEADGAAADGLRDFRAGHRAERVLDGLHEGMRVHEVRVRLPTRGKALPGVGAPGVVLHELRDELVGEAGLSHGRDELPWDHAVVTGVVSDHRQDAIDLLELEAGWLTRVIPAGVGADEDAVLEAGIDELLDPLDVVRRSRRTSHPRRDCRSNRG